MPGRRVTLLGPQGTAPDIGPCLADAGIRGQVALVRAGYQEREADDAQMIAAMGVPTVNLALHARANEVFQEDPDFATAYAARQQRLRHLQAFYRVRLDYIDQAARAIQIRHVPAELLAEEERISIDQFRRLDADHIERCDLVRAAFDAQWHMAERPVIARHRAQLGELLVGCEALVIAGGHVASLLNRLALFDMLGLAADKPVFAWAAGAMVLAQRIVLFHDYPPYGSDLAQVLDAGFGFAPDVVVLPDPQRRINLEAHDGIQRFARRMAPATCVAMDFGARLVFERGVVQHAHAIRLTTSGQVERDWEGTPSRFSRPVIGVGP